jgi:putative DNA primase/helicase
MITKLAPVVYDPGATDETLTRYLADTTGGDADFERYLQKAAGYSLTGSTQEECFFLMLGPAATGKSTLVEAMLAMLGDYGLKSSFDAFLETRNTGGATPEIARLRGARLVAAVETSKGQRLNEPAIKELTGGDSVTARHLYAAPFSFKPACKIWLAANDSPRMTDTDTGLWRRLRRLPFEREVLMADPAVKARLCSDAGPALLAWAVRGCLLWQRDGLGSCEVVKSKTRELRATFDPLAEFFDEQCILERHAETAALALRQAYETWAAGMGAKPINNREWAQRLKSKGCESIRTRRGGDPVTVWHGIGLLADEPALQQAEF